MTLFKIIKFYKHREKKWSSRSILCLSSKLENILTNQPINLCHITLQIPSYFHASKLLETAINVPKERIQTQVKGIHKIKTETFSTERRNRLKIFTWAIMKSHNSVIFESGSVQKLQKRLIHWRWKGKNIQSSYLSGSWADPGLMRAPFNFNPLNQTFFSTIWRDTEAEILSNCGHQC